jgi:putative tricarboxylic transport membrane protein
MGLLIGIYCASACGGSVPSILLKIPGTASASVTAFDGYPMAQQGRAGKALGIATASSWVGGMVSSIVLLTLCPFLAQQSLRFGPPEYFMLTVLGFASVVGMAGENVGKSIIAIAFGLMIGCVGMDPQTGSSRFTFGSLNLQDGISLVPMLIGLFGITSIMELFESFHGNEVITALKEKKSKLIKVELPDRKECKQLLPTWAQSTVIGNIIGIIPGAGMIMAIFLAYNQAVRSNPDKKFGTGVPEGIAAPECANNSVVGSSMVPLLSLGIPGNSSSALFLSALTIQGLRTGPTLFNDTPGVAYMIILGFLLSNIIMLPLAIGYTSLFATAVLRMRREILSGVVIALCVTGAFAIKNNVFNLYVIIFFGLVGYLFNKFHIPQSPLILASILGSMMESNWIQSMVFAHNDLTVFVTRPLSCVLLIISILFIVVPMLQSAKRKEQGAAEPQA